MPAATYEELLVDALPSRIENDAQSDDVVRRLGHLMVKHRHIAVEERLYRLLRVLIEDYDRRNAMPPDKSQPHYVKQKLLGKLLEPSPGLGAGWVAAQRHHHVVLGDAAAI
jgi:hypothetical protein